MNGWKRRLESVRGAKSLLMYRSGKKYSREGSRTFNSVQRGSFYRWNDDNRSKNSARGWTSYRGIVRLASGFFEGKLDIVSRPRVEIVWNDTKADQFERGSLSRTMSESLGRARGIDSQFSFVVSRANIRCRKTRCLDHSFIGVITLEPLCRRELDCDIDGLTRSTRSRFDSIQKNEIEWSIERCTRASWFIIVRWC